MNEQMHFNDIENEPVRLPLRGIPLAEMLEAIQAEGRYVHKR
jgi:hypothetical protein